MRGICNIFHENLWSCRDQGAATWPSFSETRKSRLGETGPRGSVADVEAGELAGGGADVVAFVSDVVEKSVADFFEEGIDGVPLAFGDELDTTIGQVADVTRHVVAA